MPTVAPRYCRRFLFTLSSPDSVRNPPWSREELILALDPYLRHRATGPKDPEVVALSETLNRLPIHRDRPDAARFRNPNGAYMKLQNLRRLDPEVSG